MDDVSPLDALVGLALLGFGVLLGYTTWKQTPGGAIGALKTVLTTGHLINGATGAARAQPPVTTRFGAKGTEAAAGVMGFVDGTTGQAPVVAPPVSGQGLPGEPGNASVF